MSAAPESRQDESRERAQKLIGDFLSQNEVLACDWLANVLQQAECDTRERCAQLVENFHKNESSYYNNSPSKFVMGLCRDLAERIRGKGAQ